MRSHFFYYFIVLCSQTSKRLLSFSWYAGTSSPDLLLIGHVWFLSSDCFGLLSFNLLLSSKLCILILFFIQTLLVASFFLKVPNAFFNFLFFLHLFFSLASSHCLSSTVCNSFASLSFLGFITPYSGCAFWSLLS